MDIRKYTFLVLEEEKEESERIKKVLGKEYNINLIQAFNAEEALEGIEQQKGDIEAVLIGESFLLSGEEESAKKLKDAIFSYGISMVAIMDSYSLKKAEDAVTAGAEDILIKPCEPTILQRRIYNRVMRSELAFAQEYDSLTGVYNKETFYAKAGQLMLQNQENKYTIFCLDIERFKMVNDLFGGIEGDLLLQFAAAQLKSIAEEVGGLAGRIVADIFACCYPNLNGKYSYIAKRITESLKEYPLDMEILAAIGFYPVENTSLPVSIMCDRAMLALASVKSNYMCNYEVYKDDFRSDLISQQEIINDMEYALKNQEFKIYMQPKCDMETGKIVGAEALVRWDHPDKGMISPGSFITAFENNKFILKLDDYVWEHVCIFLRNWLDAGNKEMVPISINVSMVNLYSDDLYQRLVNLVEKYKISPSLLEIEITESAYASNMQYLIKVVDRLRAYGFTILMDDFGSGYSSLNMLKDLNVDILKTDMKFLTNEIDEHEKSGEILEAVMRMAKWLNLLVIAEGVENQQQKDFLLSVNCHYAQGYYYYAPMPCNEFWKLLREPDKIDFRGMRKRQGETFKLQELMNQDVMSDTLLQNLIGGVAFYEYTNGTLSLTHANEGYYTETGCSEDEILSYGDHLSDLIYEEDQEELVRLVSTAADNPSEGAEGILRRRKLNGDLLWLRIKLFFLTENNRRQLFYGSIRNITEEKEAEARLRAFEERMRSASNITITFLFDFHIKERAVDYSEVKAGMLGRPRRLENMPQSMIDGGTIMEEYQQGILQMYEKIIKGEPQASCEIKGIQSNGQTFWARITLTSVFDEKGNPIRAMGIAESLGKKDSTA